MKRGNLIALLVLILGGFVGLGIYFFSGAESRRVEALIRETARAAAAGEQDTVLSALHEKFVFSIDDKATVEYSDLVSRNVLNQARLKKLEIRTISVDVTSRDRARAEAQIVLELGIMEINRPYPYNFTFDLIRVPDDTEPNATKWQILSCNLILKKQ